MKIRPDDKRLSYSGRIDWSDPRAPVFIYPCTSVAFRFAGERLKVHVENRRAYWANYLGCIIDGRQVTLPLPETGEAILEIPVEEEKREHSALLFKRQDACHEVKLTCIEIGEGGTLLDALPKPARRIEVYGDSVSAGEVAEAADYAGREDPEHNGEYSNSWYSYAWLTARALHAELHDIAQGGIALLDGTGWFHAPDYIGMETAWNKIRYQRELGEILRWDFEKYIPHVVIVAFGQNDSNPEDYMKEDFHGKKAENWRRRYRRFLEGLRAVYPAAHIVCCTTLLFHDRAWDDAIGQVVEEMADGKITQYLFERNGVGTPGHLRITEAKEMAAELSAYMENLGIEEWSETENKECRS